MSSGVGFVKQPSDFRIDELLAGERSALQQIAAGAPLRQVLETLTRAIDAHAGTELSCSILLLDPDGLHLRHGAAPGLPEAYIRAIDGIVIGPAVGSCGTAAYIRGAIVSADIATDPRWAGFRRIALEYGLRACWSTPVFGSGGEVLGTFALYYRQPREPRPEDRQIVELVTRTAAIAIERQRGEEERAQLLERERTARERVTRILESVSDGFIAVDREFRFTYINPAAEALMMRARRDLLGRSLWLVYPELLGSVVESAYRRALRERVAEQVEFLYAPLDKWFEANVYPSEGGGLAIYFRDTTVRKCHEEDLRNQQRWLEAVLDLLPAPTLFVEPGTARVTFSNRAARQLGGGALDPGMPAELLANGGRLDGYQMQLETPAGERSIIVYGEALPAMHGHDATGVCMFQDITEMKRAEEAFQRAQKLESLGVLAGGVAHDFNNLLTGIMGNASLLADSLGDPGDRMLAQEVVDASERAANLTKQLLAYSGKGRFFLQRVDLTAQVREIGGLIHSSIPPGVQLETHLSEILPPVMADAGQMQQVILNLLMNSAEAFHDGQPGAVRVTTGVQNLAKEGIDSSYTPCDLDPGRYVFLEVRDNGSGMDESTRARVFEPFFTTKFTGRGLGLPAVLGIVQGHKGAIRLESLPGHGTVVRVLIPALSEPDSRAGVTEEESLRGAGVVLVVDDEAIVRHTAKVALERFGYTVVAAEDGRRATEIFRTMASRVVAVLLDMTMPGMTGEETLSELQAICPDVRVLLSSGYSEDEATRRFSGRGLSGFIQKPYRSTGLARKLKSILR